MLLCGSPPPGFLVFLILFSVVMPLSTGVFTGTLVQLIRGNKKALGSVIISGVVAIIAYFPAKAFMIFGLIHFITVVIFVLALSLSLYLARINRTSSS